MGKPIRAICLLLLLSACAGAPVVQSPAELRATHGFVHVSIPGGWRDLQLSAVSGGQEYVLVRQAEHGPYAYGLWVPAGEYDVARLLGADGKPYRVTVERGRVTDMGGMVRLEIGNYEYVRLPFRHPEVAAELEQAIGALRAHLATAEPIEWKPAGVPRSERQVNPPTNLGLIADLLMDYTRHVNKPPLSQQLKEAKSNEEFFRRAAATMPPLTDEPGSDAEGRLYYGAELGQIRIRAPNGEWSNLDTGTLQTVSAVEVAGRRIVAGTGRGELRVSDDGRTWRRQFAFAPDEVVVDIDRIGERWIVMTGRLLAQPNPYGAPIFTADKFKVYSTTAQDLAGMTLLREIQLPERAFVLKGMGVRGQPAGGGWFMNVGAEMFRLDLATLQWSSSSPGHKVSGFNISPKTGLLTVYRQQGAFSKLHLSSDQGKTWRPADTPPYVFYDIYFETPERGLASRFSTGAFSSSIELLAYDPKADSWQKTHDAPPGCTQLLRDTDNVQRFCVTSGNSILNYVNGKWVAEFAVN
jgi:hypothetical protein